MQMTDSTLVSISTENFIKGYVQLTDSLRGEPPKTTLQNPTAKGAVASAG